MMQKVLCFLAAVAFFLMVSFEPVRASAVGTDDVIFTIAQWYDEVEQRIVETEQAVLTDLQNGNLDATTELGKERLREWSLQLLSVQNPVMYSIVHAVDLAIQGIPDGYEFFENNPTAEISGGGLTGVYRSYKDNELHQITLSVPNSISAFGFSDEFTLGFSTSPQYTSFRASDSSISNNSISYYFIAQVLSAPVTIYYPSTNNNYFNTSSVTYSFNISGSTFGYRLGFDNSSVPLLYNTYFSGRLNASDTIIVGGFPSEVELPETTIETTAPWDYYNTQILPRIPDLPDNYVLFPYGWNPPMDPTEPPSPTYPPGDLVLPPYGELMTEPSSYFVTDESGETMTDESGQPLTETTMVPVTVASSEDGVWRFKIPTLPDLISPSEVPTFSASLPQRLVGLSSALFQAVYEILDSSGGLGILPFLIGIAVICYMIYKIGG